MPQAVNSCQSVGEVSLSSYSWHFHMESYRVEGALEGRPPGPSISRKDGSLCFTCPRGATCLGLSNGVPTVHLCPLNPGASAAEDTLEKQPADD